MTPDDNSPSIHLHKIDNYTTEFHCAHSSGDRRSFGRELRYRLVESFVSTALRAITASCHCWRRCGFSTLIGFLLGRAGFRRELVAPFLALAYVSGGCFATQDVRHALKRNGIDIQFLMVAVVVAPCSLRMSRRRDAALSVFVEQWVVASIIAHEIPSSRCSKSRRNTHLA